MEKIFDKLTLLCVSVLLLTSCTIYTEKQSEALSRVVYATKDSLENARIDLADEYSKEAVRIVKPPKKRIKIEPIFENIYIQDNYKTETANITTNSRATLSAPLRLNAPSSLSLDTKQVPSLVERKRVLVVPERFKNDPVVAVNTVEYERLLQDQEVYKQIQKDHENLTVAKKTVDDELQKQQKFNNQMVIDLNRMQKQLVEKDLAILQRNIVIVILITILGAATYLRIKGIL